MHVCVRARQRQQHGPGQGRFAAGQGKGKAGGQKRGQEDPVPEAPPLPTFAGLAVGDGLAHVAVVALLAVVAVAAGRVVAAVETDAPTLAPRQLVQLHVEAAAPGVQVTVTGCGEAGRGVRAGAREGLAPASPQGRGWAAVLPRELLLGSSVCTYQPPSNP